MVSTLFIYIIMRSTKKQIHIYKQLNYNKQIKQQNGMNNYLKNQTDHQIRHMKASKILKNKSSSIMLCKKCNYFPTQEQAKQLIQNQSIFQIKWTCVQCQTANLLPSDEQFNYYFNNQLMIDESDGKSKQILILIDIDSCMKQMYANLTNHSSNGINGNINNSNINLGNNKKTQQITMKTLLQQSPLLSAYMESNAIQMRRTKGPYFSWQHYTRKKCITKIQYCLWLADFLRVQLKNVKISFFVSHSANKELGILGKQFQELLLMKKIGAIETINLNRVKEHTSNISQMIVLSGSPLYNTYAQILRLKLNQSQVQTQTQRKRSTEPQKQGQRCGRAGVKTNKIKVLIVNFQEKVDAVTLMPTSTSNYLSARTNNKSQAIDQMMGNTSTDNNCQQRKKEKQRRQDDEEYVQIVDWRMYEVQVIRQFANLIKQSIMIQHSQITIYSKKISKNNNNSPSILNKSGSVNAVNNYSSINNLIHSNMNISHKNSQILLQTGCTTSIGSPATAVSVSKQRDRQMDWSKLLDRQMCRFLLYARYKPKEKDKPVHAGLLPNQKNKISQLAYQFIQLLISYYTNGNAGIQTIQQFLKGASGIARRNSQLRIILRFHNHYNSYLVLWASCNDNHNSSPSKYRRYTNNCSEGSGSKMGIMNVNRQDDVVNSSTSNQASISDNIQQQQPEPESLYAFNSEYVCKLCKYQQQNLDNSYTIYTSTTHINNMLQFLDNTKFYALQLQQI